MSGGWRLNSQGESERRGMEAFAEISWIALLSVGAMVYTGLGLARWFALTGNRGEAPLIAPFIGLVGGVYPR
jgi:hypothetical protein